MPARSESNAKAFGAANTGADYTPQEIAFLKAVEVFKRRHRVKFPSFVDVLRVACEMGYRPPGEDGAARVKA